METATVRRHWMEVIDDVEKELKKLLSQEQKKTSDMEKRALTAEEENSMYRQKAMGFLHRKNIPAAVIIMRQGK